MSDTTDISRWLFCLVLVYLYLHIVSGVLTDKHLECKPHHRRRRLTTTRCTGQARRLTAWRSLLLRTILGTVGMEAQSDLQDDYKSDCDMMKMIK